MFEAVRGRPNAKATCVYLKQHTAHPTRNHQSFRTSDCHDRIPFWALRMQKVHKIVYTQHDGQRHAGKVYVEIVHHSGFCKQNQLFHIEQDVKVPGCLRNRDFQMSSQKNVSSRMFLLTVEVIFCVIVEYKGRG